MSNTTTKPKISPARKATTTQRRASTNGARNGATSTRKPTGSAPKGMRSYPRHFTAALAGADVFSSVEWEIRNAKIGDKFEQNNVEFPASWSQNATNIVSEKYFRGQIDSPSRERSVRQMIGRVAGTIADWGRQRGYFTTKAARDAFYDELAYLLLHQMAAFNSPVWFNLGYEENPQCSACFLLGVDDTFHPDNPNAIDKWNVKEGIIFRGGSGAGINVSKIRGSKERMSKGGYASGPISFMEGTDAWAGVIKSGGKTRRAAKMVVMDIDHPDIIEFIKIKAAQEAVADDLRALGYPMDLDSDYLRRNVQFQNANLSVRLSDAFMRAVERGEDWNLIARKETDPETGEKKVMGTVEARWLMKLIAECAHRCGDPGVHFDDTQNRWHTNPNTGPITTSNPCSEYLSIDDSACNLASVNFMKFFANGNGDLDLVAYGHVIDTVLLAQEILVGTREQPSSSYPTEAITDNAHDFRQLGMGGVNLGAQIMALGVPYDSDEGRAIGAALTSYMSARAWRESALMAKAMGPYAGYAINAAAHLKVVAMHREEHARKSIAGEFSSLPRELGEIVDAAADMWDEAVALGEKYGYRNAQVTLYAPTGTISFLMDCDTTGMEPAFSLITYKKLVGGGDLTMVNSAAALALRKLGYDERAIDAIGQHILEHGDVADSPLINMIDVPVFDVAVGRRAIAPMGHVKMMAALQPFLSGAISKTVNMPKETSVEEIEEVYTASWRMGIKALAIYRDGSKATTVLSTGEEGESDLTPRSKPAFRPDEVEHMISREVALAEARPLRMRMPRTRSSITHKVALGGGQTECYISAGCRDNGTFGELFITGLDKEGSEARGLANSFATAFSIAVQYGVPLADFLKKFAQGRFGDAGGPTGNPEIPMSGSLVDYICRWVALEFLDEDDWYGFGLRPTTETIALRRAYPNVPISMAREVNQRDDIELDIAAIEREQLTAKALELGVDLTALGVSTAEAPALAATKTQAIVAEARQKLARGEVVQWAGGRCHACGSTHLLPAGSCKVCNDCAATTGCG